MKRRTIGWVAKEAGVGVETVRFYERRGLIDQPQTPRQGWREYGTDTVRAIRFIKRAQELGFTLAEIEDLLALRTAKRTRCSEVRAATEEKINAVDAKLRDLRRIRKALAKLAKACATSGDELHCPILDVLAE